MTPGETLLIVADVLDRFTRQVDQLFGCNGFRPAHLTSHNDTVGRYQRFTRHAGFRIRRQIRVQNGIADPVSNFIGMTFRNRFRSKQKIAVFTHDGAVRPTPVKKGNR